MLLAVRDASNLRMPGAHKVTFETLEFAMYRGHFCIVDLIAIADVGNADRMRVKLSVDEHYDLTHEVLPLVDDALSLSQDIGPAARSQGIVVRDSKADIARVLGDFVESGVRERNKLNRPLDVFDYEAERQELVEWSDRVVEKLEAEFVTAGERSRFKTLDKYESEPMGSGNISPQQIHIQTMWTEKIKRLRAIIDRIGG